MTTLSLPQAATNGEHHADPTDQVEAMTGRRHLSWSQLSSFRNCPRKWRFSHVEQEPPAFVASSLRFGGAFHAAVQRHYEGLLTGATLTPEDLLAAYDEAWSGEERDQGIPVRYGKKEDEASLRTQAAAMLAAFLEHPVSHLEGDLIGIEESVTGELLPGLPDVTARVDLMWRDDDGLHLADLKTSRSKWTESKAAESAGQLRLYARLLDGLREDEAPILLHYIVVTKTKSPTVQLLDVPAGDPLPALKQFIPVWQAMRSGVDFTNPGAMQCPGCPYRDRCPAFA